MAMRYQLHPALGIARVGNSPANFYLAPEAIGGLPIECDEYGNVQVSNGKPAPVRQFKDDAGCVRRQASRFHIFAYDDSNPNDPGREVSLDDSDVASIEWTVHLANKKAIWYPFSVEAGNLMLPRNSYGDRQVSPRNQDVTDPAKRQKLIIDPGPRTISGAQSTVPISKSNIPPTYDFGSFPDQQEPETIEKLGDLITDAQGRLLVLGGLGHCCGDTPMLGFFEGEGWYDDVSDGPVYCRLTLKNGQTINLYAWVLVAAPKFAPELVNVVTMDDIMYDLSVRYFDYQPDLYQPMTGWNQNYKASHKKDVEPIVRRMAGYHWVANVPFMTTCAAPRFDLGDSSEANRPNRENYFRYFRRALAPNSEQNTLMRPGDGLPLMPLNSGSNSVSNQEIIKFLTLTETQYFLLGQWAAGKFVNDAPASGSARVHPLDRASVGNCVGLPVCPGIESTWNMQNPIIYEAPYRIKPRYPDESHYYESGLSIQTYDETAKSSQGCEPGDLTKRMSVPWQNDFFGCTVQHVNFRDPKVNVDKSLLPVPPTYMVYWWPPQSPLAVISGAMTLEEQEAAGIDAGSQVPFMRGINSYQDFIVAWSYLGFVLNQNQGADREDYPYFTEQQRNHSEFTPSSVAVGDPFNAVLASDTTFTPVWFLNREHAKRKPKAHRVRAHGISEKSR
jgi:L-lysine 6-oxidase